MEHWCIKWIFKGDLLWFSWFFGIYLLFQCWMLIFNTDKVSNKEVSACSGSFFPLSSLWCHRERERDLRYRSPIHLLFALGSQLEENWWAEGLQQGHVGKIKIILNCWSCKATLAGCQSVKYRAGSEQERSNFHRNVKELKHGWTHGRPTGHRHWLDLH